MSWRREFSKLNATLHQRTPDDDLSDEIQSHLRLEELENVASGMSADEAHHAALRRFGNVTLTRERSREMWVWSSIEVLFQDLRFGARQLRHNPGFTAVAVITLALGIGAATAMFSVVNSVLLKPLPYQNPERLVSLFETEVAPGNYPLSGADYLDWQAQNRSLEGSTLYSWPQSMSASGASEPEPASVVSTQANFFRVLGVQPLIGRGFVAGEDRAGKNRVAVISYGFWQRHFGGADSLGKSVVLDSQPYRVVGVMPRWFNFLRATDLWTPLDMSPKALGPRGNHGWSAIAKLRDGVTLPQASAELLAISKRLEQQYKDSNEHVHAVLQPLKDVITGDSRTPLVLLLGAVTLVLLVACVNVANLQLARGSSRHREMAVRSSLGAGRFRLIRQLLAESVMLSLAGAALGTAGAWCCVRLLESIKTLPIPRANPIEIDGAVLLFAIALSLSAGVLFGLAPALQSSRASINEELKTGSQGVLGATRGRWLLRDFLVIAEISMTLALLAGAGLLLRSFERIRNADIGIDPKNVMTAFINIPHETYKTLATRRQFFDRLIDRVQAAPGVESVTVSTEIPLEGGNNGYVHKDGDSDPSFSRQLVGANFISPDYFRTLSIPVLKGRVFRTNDIEHTAVSAQKLFELYQASTNGDLKAPADMGIGAVISQSMARTFWKNTDPVGRSYHWNDVQVTVIGVVADVKEYGIRAQGMPQAYYALPLALIDGGFGRLTLKTRIPPTAVLADVRSGVRALDGGLALFQPRTMDEVIAEDARDMTIQALLLAVFAILALVLAAVGLYGVMSYLVTQRTREIGIRMALGARRSNVLRLVMMHGAKITAAGILIGLAASLAIARGMANLLYGVSSSDPLTFAAVAVMLSLVALTAYYIPARRATRVDPIQALRYE